MHYPAIKVYRVHSVAPGGVPWFFRAGWTVSHDTTTDIQEAEVFLSGDLRGDGCSNWRLLPGEDAMSAHFCNREDLVAIGTLMGRLYDLGPKLIPAWIDD